jgi:type IV secretory pathway VirB3-like protein
MLLSLEFVALIVIVALNLDVLLSLLIVVVMAAISSIIAARDAGYISLF